MERKFPKNSPRYQAGGFELKDGTGPITGMQSYGNFLEIYKKDKTFRVQTPESLDPEETNENVPWVATPVADVGSANPIVSRVFIQACDILSAAILKSDVNKDDLIVELHSRVNPRYRRVTMVLGFEAFQSSVQRGEWSFIIKLVMKKPIIKGLSVVMVDRAQPKFTNGHLEYRFYRTPLRIKLRRGNLGQMYDVSCFL